MLISNTTILFQIYSPKYPNEAILVPNLIFSLFCTIFCILANSRMLIPHVTIVFFQFLVLKYPKGHFWSQSYRFFFFARNVFKTVTHIYKNKAFLVPILKLFVLHILPFHKSGVADPKFFCFFFKKRFWSKNIEK